MGGGSIPIYSASAAPMVDSLPQALMITAIVIGASVTALALMISKKYSIISGHWNGGSYLSRIEMMEQGPCRERGEKRGRDGFVVRGKAEDDD